MPGVELRAEDFFLNQALVLPDRQLRITKRCLAEDLGMDADASFEDVSGHPIVKAFLRERRDKYEGSSRIEPLTSGAEVSVLRHQHHHRGGTWRDTKFEDVIWLVAYGHHKSGAEDDFFPWCKELDADGNLLPTASDYESLIEDRSLRLARMLQIQPPILLKKARESGEEEREVIGGVYGTAVSIEFADDIEAISVAFDTRSEDFYRTLPVVLAAFVPTASATEWEDQATMPSRDLESYEVAFSYVGEVP
jgi:hypothetical protein